MTIKLHENCKSQIKAALIENIPKVLVKNNMFPERSSIANLIVADGPLPKHGKQFEELQQYIGDYPFFEFVDGLLADELHAHNDYVAGDASIPLNSIPGFENCDAVAERWISSFESLPWIYSLSIKFPAAISDILKIFVKDTKISNSFHLVRPDETSDSVYPLTGADDVGALSNLFSLTTLGAPGKWNQDAVYAQIKVSGFIGRYGGTAPWQKAEDLLKSFCGLALALRLFQVKPTYIQVPPTTEAIIHRRISENTWSFATKTGIDRALSGAFNDLVPHDLDGSLDSNQKKESWILSGIPDLHAVFSAQEKNEKILLASRWLFDSFSGQNTLLAFVQTMVALEILLGEDSDRSDISLGELLRNRCAFLIGTSHEQRSRLLKDFDKIYRVRSQIVHRGKGRLTAKEFGLFSQLQWICRRAIQEEVRLLKADK